MIFSRYVYYLFLVILLCASVKVDAKRRCDCRDSLLEVLKSEDFEKRVYRITQEYKDVQTACKVKNQFTYQDHVGICLNCSSICDLDTENDKKQCMDHCEPYVVHELAQKRFALVKEKQENLQKKVDFLTKELEEASAFNKKMTIFVLCVLGTVVVIFFLALYKMWNYNEKHYAKLQVSCPSADYDDDDDREISASQNTFSTVAEPKQTLCCGPTSYNPVNSSSSSCLGRCFGRNSETKTAQPV